MSSYPPKVGGPVIREHERDRLGVVEVLDVGRDLGPAEGKRRAKDVVAGDDVAAALLHDDRFDLPEPREACRDRGDVAATWIPRVELDRVDWDDEGAQLGRDVGSSRPLERCRSGLGGRTFDRRVGDARGTRVCGEDGVVRCSSHGVGLRLLGRRDPWLESCSLRRGFEVGRIGAPVDGPRAALERPGARKLRTHWRGGLVPRRLDDCLLPGAPRLRGGNLHHLDAEARSSGHTRRNRRVVTRERADRAPGRPVAS